MKTLTKDGMRQRRHRRVRAKVVGTPERPRLTIYRSNTRVIAQIIDDAAGKTVAYVSSSSEKAKTPKERAEAAAKRLAGLAKTKGITRVVFDRGGFQYLGTIKAFADAVRAEGLEF